MKPYTPTLAELQSAMLRSVLHGEDDDVAAWVVTDGLKATARLNIYRSTAANALVGALRLAFPCVLRVVGADFFEGAARLFCRAAPPQVACLDAYGAEFPAFLARLPQAASVPYLAGVASLEWQVNIVLHAPDARALDLERLAGLDEAALGGLRLTPHPAVRLECCGFPSDAIWRAVLEESDQALNAIDLDDGPVRLLVQRTADGVDVLRLSEGDWCIVRALFDGEPILTALARAPDADGHALIAACFARGCFTQASLPGESRDLGGGSPA